MQHDAHEIGDDSAEEEAEYSSGEIIDYPGNKLGKNNVLTALAVNSTPKTAEPVSDEVELTVECRASICRH